MQTGKSSIAGEMDCDFRRPRMSLSRLPGVYRYTTGPFIHRARVEQAAAAAVVRSSSTQQRLMITTRWSIHPPVLLHPTRAKSNCQLFTTGSFCSPVAYFSLSTHTHTHLHTQTPWVRSHVQVREQVDHGHHVLCHRVRHERRVPLELDDHATGGAARGQAVGQAQIAEQLEPWAHGAQKSSGVLTEAQRASIYGILLMYICPVVRNTYIEYTSISWVLTETRARTHYLSAWGKKEGSDHERSGAFTASLACLPGTLKI